MMFPFYLDFIYVGLIGLILGSYASVLISRETLEPLPVSKKHFPDKRRSFCPSCHHRLGAKDLVPLLSWFIQKGRCRYCGETISKLYPFLEILSALACLTAYMMMGASWSFLLVLALIPVLLGLFFIDLRLMILPNKLVLAMALLGMGFQGLRLFEDPEGVDVFATVFDYGGGAILYSGSIWLIGVIMEKILKKEALGFGDVKFFAAAGLWLGVSNLPYFMILSGGIGVFIALFQSVKSKRNPAGALFPFGPALVLAVYFILVFQSYTFF